MRLKSLDVFRGLAIATMILVNNPGSWEQVYPPLQHAPWHGCTPTDLIFPCFLFIVGVALSFSLTKLIQDGPSVDIYKRILQRSAILFLLGLLLNTSSIILDILLNGAAFSKLGSLRLMGVLQRISLAYGLGAIAILKFSPRQQRIFATLILLGYWAALTLIPVPGYGSGNLTPEGNLGAYLDCLILTPTHLYKGGPFDPEGLLSTLPAIVTLLGGYWTGEWLRLQPIKSRTSWNLVLWGLSCVVIGYLWGYLFPINKQLWTSSYVVLTGGWALLILAACYETIEVKQWRWGWPWEVMGVNAIFAFVASGLVARLLLKTKIGSTTPAPTTYSWIYETVFVPLFGPLNGSLAFAGATVLVWWVILFLLYRQRWFLKI